MFNLTKRTQHGFDLTQLLFHSGESPRCERVRGVECGEQLFEVADFAGNKESWCSVMRVLLL